jgi:hypothetical protein
VERDGLFVLDGFAAFSLDPATASNYADDGGIVFETLVTAGAYLPGVQDEILRTPLDVYRVVGVLRDVLFIRGDRESSRHAMIQLEEVPGVQQR